MTLPAFNHRGLIPPFRDPEQPTSPARSPYPIDITDFTSQFSTTPARCAILQGFLKYRETLHSAGLTTGFQWVDGSFLEQVEITQNRDPSDLDVVSFFNLPAGIDENEFSRRNPDLFDRSKAKTNYRVDSYPVVLSWKPDLLVWWSAYWYSVWGHRRNLEWKGFVQIDLAPTHDREALRALTSAHDKAIL